MPPPHRPPTLHLVLDTDMRPARYGVMAALLTQALYDTMRASDDRPSTAMRDIAFGHLPFYFDTACYADAVQHVAPSGDLLPSGLLWYERLCARPAPQPRALEAWLAEWFDAGPGIAVNPTGFDDGVLPLHLGVTCSAENIAQRIEQACAAMRHVDGIVRCYRVIETRHDGEARWALVVIDPADAALFAQTTSSTRAHDVASEAGMLPWRARQDRYGRWERVLPSTAAAAKTTPSETIRIALIGTEAEQRDGYPGTLAALGDAADSMGLTLDVRFVAPYDAAALVATLHHLTRQPAEAAHDDAAPSAQDDPRAPCDTALPLRGLVLPGGADMQRVAGQIAAAAYGWTYRLPTLGLCLGMQTMATAALQRATGRSDMTLLELAPDTAVPSFVRNADGGHRLGLHPIVGTQKAETHGAIRGDNDTSPDSAIGTAIRCNHRFRLNPALYTALTAASIDIIAWDRTATIVDGIAAMPQAGQPFYAGMQGHPELMSMSGRPHPLFLAWLRAIATPRH